MLDSMPLALYAAEHWIGHAKSGGVGPTVLQLMLHLFTSGSAPFKNWIQMYDIDAGRYGSYGKPVMGFATSTVYYSSLAGMQELLGCLLHKGENANAKGGRFGNPLQAASFEGYEAIVKLLLENGAEVNAKGGEYGNALQAAAASYQVNDAIVKLLLENGADVNAKGGMYVNALQAAALAASYPSQGNVAIVKLLLENGADINAEAGEYGNALQAVSSSGNEAIAKLLLENGAEVNAKGGEYVNALYTASFRGSNEAIVKLLLKNWAEVNAKGGEYGNALQAALIGDNKERWFSSKDNEEIVHFARYPFHALSTNSSSTRPPSRPPRCSPNWHICLEKIPGNLLGKVIDNIDWNWIGV